MSGLTNEDKKAELRMWIVIRTDLDLSPGKLAAQAGHAVATALLDAIAADPGLVQAYMDASQAKIAVGAKSAEELAKVFEAARQAGLPASIITDAGRTEFAEPTLTTACFGPCRRNDLPPLLERLRLYAGHKAPTAPVVEEQGA